MYIYLSSLFNKKHHELTWVIMNGNFVSKYHQVQILVTIVLNQNNLTGSFIKQKLKNMSVRKMLQCTATLDVLKHFCCNLVFLFSPDEGSCYIVLTLNNCCKFLH